LKSPLLIVFFFALSHLGFRWVKIWNSKSTC
jgi:hypothetical protein